MAKGFTKQEKMDRIRQAMDIYIQTGAWRNCEHIVHRQNVEKWIRDPEIFAYAESIGYEPLDTMPVATFAPKTAHFTARLTFQGALMNMRDGKVVARDGARIQYGIRDNAMVMYKLDGIGNRHCAGPAYLRGADVLANDWTIAE